MEKINIAELLKDCPKGMELDCALYDDVTLGDVTFESDYHYDKVNNYPIIIVTKNGFSTRLTKYGQNVDIDEAKCVIFPKGKNTWEGFHRPFVDGDIITDSFLNTICIFKREGSIHGTVDFYCGIGDTDELFIKDVKDRDEHFGEITGYDFATEDEKETLFKVIKDNGYKWNEETKTLEKLIEPKFKVGDRIEFKYHERSPELVVKIKDNGYLLSCGITLMFQDEDAWELYSGKFDITTLKPFDKVLVRLTKDGVWNATFFSHYDREVKWGCYPFVTTSSKSYSMCIPYEGNEHLLNTTNDCDEFYKTWE